MKRSDTFAIGGKKVWCPAKFVAGALAMTALALIVIGVSIHFVERKEGYKLRAICLNHTCYFSDSSLSAAVRCTAVNDCLRAVSSAPVSVPLLCQGDSDCQNGGTCLWNERRGRSKCLCPSGFSGIHCEISTRCATALCLNGGTCRDSESGPICLCSQSYTGIVCDSRVETVNCPHESCLNGGKCTRKMDRMFCDCGPTHVGPKCEHRLPSRVNAVLVGVSGETANETWTAVAEGEGEPDGIEPCIRLLRKAGGDLQWDFAVRLDSTTWWSESVTLHRFQNETSIWGTYEGASQKGRKLVVHLETIPNVTQVHSHTHPHQSTFFFVRENDIPDVLSELVSRGNFEWVNGTHCPL